MKNLFFARHRSFLHFFLVFGLIISLFLGNTSFALAARSGGRIGGGSFRAPMRSAPAPSRGGGGGFVGGGGGFGGGMGFPFLIPFMAFGGGGSLFTLLIFLAIAGFLVNTFKSIAGGSTGSGNNGYGTSYDNPPVSVTKIQVGLLASARELQTELNELANHADTGTASGRAQVLQEASLALLRHPEYWVYGSTEAETAPLTSAEAKFNQFSLGERSKFAEETLTNVNSQRKQAAPKALLDGNGDPQSALNGELGASGEYILVTIIAGVEGKIEIPKINDSSDLRTVLQSIGGIGSDRLLAIEVLWTPQAEGDTLSSEDIQASYPNLKLV